MLTDQLSNDRMARFEVRFKGGWHPVVGYIDQRNHLVYQRKGKTCIRRVGCWRFRERKALDT